MSNFVQISCQMKMFPFKHLIPIVQFVWQLYAIVVQSRRFGQWTASCGEKGMYKYSDRYLKSIVPFAYIQTDRQTAKSTQLIIQIYILWGSRWFFLGVANIVTNLIYPVQNIKINIKNTVCLGHKKVSFHQISWKKKLFLQDKKSPKAGLFNFSHIFWGYVKRVLI